MIAAFWLALCLPAAARAAAPISVVRPFADAVIPTTSWEWIDGSVEQPAALFTINGTTVPIYRTGAFLAWLPVTPGTFTFHCELTLKDGTTFSYLRDVFITPPPSPLPAKPIALDKDSLWPAADAVLRPGDWLTARAKASPGASVKFRLYHRDWIPMRAVNPGLGLYEGVYLAQPGDNLDPAPVEYKAGSDSEKSAGKVALRSSPAPVAALKNGADVDLKTGYAGGELFPALGGARFLTAGSEGAHTKLQLSGGQTAWTETRNLEFSPDGTPPPSAVSDTISVKPGEEGETVVHFSLSARVPFEVQEADDLNSLTVRLHYTSNHTNWIVYDSGDDYVDSVRWRQEAEGLMAVDIRLKPGRRLWGYQAGYDNTSLKLELRHAPRLSARVLEGRTIFLDPGHMPSAPGAIGPLGTKEMDVNYLIAKDVEKLLLQAGAKPVMSRQSDDDEVGLQDRPRLAWEHRADVFLSIHNNNLAGESNPFKSPHGYSVFFDQPGSLDLARDIYQAYGRLVPLPGEQLRFGNLLVARQTAMPAVLTESAYMTYPDQEAMLLDSEFRHKLAQAMVEGLRSFFESEHARQQPSASAPAPASKSTKAAAKKPAAKPAKKSKRKK